MFDVSFLLILIIIVALIFDFTNGAHDCANAIATVVSTKVLSPRVAVAMAASLFGKTYGTDYLFSTRATAVSTMLAASTIPSLGALCELLGG